MGLFNMKLAYDVIYPNENLNGNKLKRKLNLPPVLMLHGMIDSRKTWKFIAPEIADWTGRVVYVIDARNHGDSPWSKEMNWVVLADDIGDFLVQHNIPKAVLVGHSMGGRAAFTFALKNPGMVDKLIVEDIAVRKIRVKDGGVIINIISLLKESLNAIPKGVDELTAKNTIIEYMKGFFPEGATTPNFPVFDMDFLPLRKDGDTFKWKANLEALEEFLTSEDLAHDVTPLGIYDGDALFFYGTKSFFGVNKDPVLPKLFPRAQKIPFEGAYHLLHHMNPQQFVRLAVLFINGENPISKL